MGLIILLSQSLMLPSHNPSMLYRQKLYRNKHDYSLAEGRLLSYNHQEPSYIDLLINMTSPSHECNMPNYMRAILILSMEELISQTFTN